MAVSCPICSSRNRRWIGRDVAYPVTSLLVALGSYALPVIYVVSRPHIVECSECGARYRKRKWPAYVALPILWYCVGVPAILFVASVVIGLVMVIFGR